MQRKNMMRAVIVLACLGLTACNTVRGVGRDVQSVGSAVEKSTN